VAAGKNGFDKSLANSFVLICAIRDHGVKYSTLTAAKVIRCVKAAKLDLKFRNDPTHGVTQRMSRWEKYFELVAKQ